MVGGLAPALDFITLTLVPLAFHFGSFKTSMRAIESRCKSRVLHLRQHLVTWTAESHLPSLWFLMTSVGLIQPQDALGVALRFITYTIIIIWGNFLHKKT